MTKVIRNGLYSISTKFLDGVYGGATGISVLRNGKMLVGGSVCWKTRRHKMKAKWPSKTTCRDLTRRRKRVARSDGNQSAHWE
jgi:hypothetical protein